MEGIRWAPSEIWSRTQHKEIPSVHELMDGSSIDGPHFMGGKMEKKKNRVTPKTYNKITSFPSQQIELRGRTFFFESICFFRVWKSPKPKSAKSPHLWMIYHPIYFLKYALIIFDSQFLLFQSTFVWGTCHQESVDSPSSWLLFAATLTFARDRSRISFDMLKSLRSASVFELSKTI
jgi:hypothetical protein